MSLEKLWHIVFEIMILSSMIKELYQYTLIKILETILNTFGA